MQKRRTIAYNVILLQRNAEIEKMISYDYGDNVLYHRFVALGY